METGMPVRVMVSVVMIFFDAETFIEEGIRSVFAQTYDNWELLLIDDGSGDNSSHIAKRYAATYPGKVRYLEHKGHRNLGKSTSRNLGITNAKGGYVAFLDADDVFLPDKLNRQVEILEFQREAAMVYGRTQYWYGWTGNRRDNRRDKFSKLGVQHDKIYNPPILVTRFIENGGIVPCICSLLIRRQVLLDIGGFEESIQDLYEDQVLIAKVCLQMSVYVEGGCGERYRQHVDSSSYKAILKGDYHPLRWNSARLNFLTWLASYAGDSGQHDLSLSKALQNELWLSRYPIAYNLMSYGKYVRNWIIGCLESVGKRRPVL